MSLTRNRLLAQNDSYLLTHRSKICRSGAALSELMDLRPSRRVMIRPAARSTSSRQRSKIELMISLTASVPSAPRVPSRSDSRVKPETSATTAVASRWDQRRSSIGQVRAETDSKSSSGADLSAV